MSVITQEYDIDLKATGEYPVVKMSQFDTGSRTIVFTVYDGHELAKIDGMVARVDGTRNDGVEFSVSCTVSTGSKVSFTITQEMTKTAGKNAAELVIFDAGGNPIGTQNFIIEVEPAVMRRDAAVNADDRTLYDQFTQSLESKFNTFTAGVNGTIYNINDLLGASSKPITIFDGYGRIDDVTTLPVKITYDPITAMVHAKVTGSMVQIYDAANYWRLCEIPIEYCPDKSDFNFTLGGEPNTAYLIGYDSQKEATTGDTVDYFGWVLQEKDDGEESCYFELTIGPKIATGKYYNLSLDAYWYARGGKYMGVTPMPEVSRPIVVDDSVYTAAIQDGAVTNDKIPVGELTASRFSANTGFTPTRVAYAENVLDVRNARLLKIADHSVGNVLAIDSSENFSVTPGDSDDQINVQIPIIGNPGDVRVRVQITPKPAKAFADTAVSMDSAVRCYSWSATGGSDVVTKTLSLVNASYDDSQACYVFNGTNATANAYLVLQIPVDASERGKKISISAIATDGRGANVEIPRGIKYDMVKPVDDTVTGLYRRVQNAASSPVTEITGNTAKWTVTGGVRTGVSTFYNLHEIIDASMGKLRVHVVCNKPVHVAAVTNSGSIKEVFGFGRDLPAGDHYVDYDLAEIDAHGNAPLDRVWITGTEDGDYELTAKFTMRDEFHDDGDLRGTLRRIEALATKPAEEQLLTSANGSQFRLTVGNDGTLGVQQISKPIKRVHVIGNSLTIDGTAGWHCGMAASTPEKDWYYLTYQNLKQRNNAVVCHAYDDEDKSADTMTRTSGYVFEQGADAVSINQLVGTVPSDADLVILQLGDNVNTSDRQDKFNRNIAGLMDGIKTKSPGAIIIFMGIWFNQESIVDSVRDALARVGGYYVPISDLRTAANASSIGATVTWTDRTQHTVDSAGVAAHPGDMGFQAIANRLWETLGKIAVQA